MGVWPMGIVEKDEKQAFFVFIPKLTK